MKNTIPLILLLFCIHLGVGARPSEGKSIVVLHSINFEESWTKQTYLDIENKFGKEGFTVKAIPLQIPGIRTMEGFQEKRKMILERVPVPPTLVVCIGDPSWLITRPLFDKEWKDVPSIICYARDNMYPKEEYLIDLDTNALETLTPITDVVKGYNATFIKYSVYIKQTIWRPCYRKISRASNSSRCLRLPFPPRTYWTGWPLSTIRPASFITHGTGPRRTTRIVT